MTFGILNLQDGLVVGDRLEIVSLIDNDDLTVVVPGYTGWWPATICSLQSNRLALLEQQAIFVLAR